MSHTRANHYFVQAEATEQPHHTYLDSVNASWMYQAAVYEMAGDVLRSHSLRSVLDVGCGFGLKLAEFLHPLCDDITGVDTAHAIDYCRSHHRFGTWICEDIEQARLDLGRSFDLIIAADIIEHLVDPDRLLDVCRRHSHPRTRIVISTPERDLKRGPDGGGGRNPTHVREWNRSELGRYLDSRGFEVVEHRLVEEARRRGFVARARLAAARLVRNTRTTQVVVCRSRSPGMPAASPPSGARR